MKKYDLLLIVNSEIKEVIISNASLSVCKYHKELNKNKVGLLQCRKVVI